MTLYDLNQGESAVVLRVLGHGAFRKRIAEMGFVRGKVVAVVKKAPLKDPVEYSIMGYNVSLRRNEARMIEVIPGDITTDITTGEVNGTTQISDEGYRKPEDHLAQRVIDVALVGNPNSGKTSIFNFASGSREHVGNYGGVTVDSKQAKVHLNGYMINIMDLPGTYSLTAYSPEELYVRKYLLEYQPDFVINIIDSSNLERNLYLTTQLIDMGLPLVVALNMYDELESKGDKFDHEALGRMLGIPFVPTVGNRGKGIRELFEKIIEVYEDREGDVRRIQINYGSHVEESIQRLQNLIMKNKGYTDHISPRFYAIKLLEKDKTVMQVLSRQANASQILSACEEEIQRLDSLLHEDAETLITDAKYGFIAGALKETYRHDSSRKNLKTETEIIDTFITHKIFGFPVFILFLWVMFQATFNLGDYAKQWIEGLVHVTSGLAGAYLPEGIARDLIKNGIIEGVGSVIVFLPNILILFFFISLMEDTGYMARAVFIMDKVMHRIGLHGKSFIPLIMGFGCNVPAIMATRTLENRNDRILTMLINPFMSCSARLPVYILIIGAFFPAHQVTVLFLIYLIGILFAVIMALIFKRTLFRSEEAPFVMELPPYRIPTLKATLLHMWNKASQYLKKMGGVILIASITIWFLGYFPRNTNETADLDRQIALLQSEQPTEKPAAQMKESAATVSHDSLIVVLTAERDRIRFDQSFIGQIGRLIEPVMQPLGFDWKMSVSLLAGVVAKEVVISTLSLLYQADHDDISGSLIPKLQSARHQDGPRTGLPVFTPVVAFGFLMFILLYFPCVAVVAAVRKESGSWKWAFFLVGYTTLLAWITSFVTYQLGSLLF
ncbi:MAG: ferrous iron transport protein B [Bacteroidales bacterium]|nr:ferrous iron transport protein B [Bacteroidales bacterium]